jgi:hypothetical protein
MDVLSQLTARRLYQVYRPETGELEKARRLRGGKK